MFEYVGDIWNRERGGKRPARLLAQVRLTAGLGSMQQRPIDSAIK
jgi:hypothetical protein